LTAGKRQWRPKLRLNDEVSCKICDVSGGEGKDKCSFACSDTRVLIQESIENDFTCFGNLCFGVEKVFVKLRFNKVVMTEPKPWFPLRIADALRSAKNFGEYRDNRGSYMPLRDPRTSWGRDL